MVHSPMAWRVFEFGFRRWRRGRLESMHLAGLPDPAIGSGTPLLVVANHVSWWDGFLIREIHRILRPGEPFFTVMLEEELRSHPFLRRLGGIGLIPGSTGSLRQLLRSMDRVRREAPGAVVLFFPQGRLWPSHRRPLGFQRGVGAVWKALGGPVVLPVGLHLSPGSTSGQRAWLSAGPVLDGGHPGADSVPLLEERVEAELDAILGFLARHGEDAPHRWPAPPAPLPRAPGTPRHSTEPNGAAVPTPRSPAPRPWTNERDVT